MVAHETSRDGPAVGPAPARDPFDPDYCRDLLESVFAPIGRHYFRPRLIGAERLPLSGPTVLVANHSGTAFPYDAMVLQGLLWERDDFDPDSMVRPVFEAELALHRWTRPFGIDDFWRRCGGVDLTFDNFDRLMRRGDRVLIFPEGVPGIGKGFNKRYRLQPFSSSFVVMASRHDAPVIPVHVVNAEWVLPFNITLPAVDRIAQSVGLPFFPLPAGFLTLLLPWMLYLSLPARMVFVVGEPIDVASRVRTAGVCDGDREGVRAIAAVIRGEMQADLDRHVAIHGRKPYDWGSLSRELRRTRGHWHEFLPYAWPRRFVRHDRDRHRPPARGPLHRWLRDLDVLGFSVPLGWLALALARRWRRPPCGYRGLTVAERREREGSYVWHLSERPLPPRPPTMR